MMHESSTTGDEQSGQYAGKKFWRCWRGKKKKRRKKTKEMQDQRMEGAGQSDPSWIRSQRQSLLHQL